MSKQMPLPPAPEDRTAETMMAYLEAMQAYNQSAEYVHQDIYDSIKRTTTINAYREGIALFAEKNNVTKTLYSAGGSFDDLDKEFLTKQTINRIVKRYGKAKFDGVKLVLETCVIGDVAE